MNSRELRSAFWAANPGFNRRHKIKSCDGKGLMHPADIRTAWVDFVDAQHREGRITDKVADNATLIPGKYITSWEVQGDYGNGFECLCAGSYRECKDNLRDYRENAPGYPYRIKRVREYQPGE